MKLVFLYGLPGVGKLTVARELAKLTGFGVFHNHLTVDLVSAVFDFGSEPFIEARKAIWLYMMRQAVTADVPGLIFTFALDRTVQNTFVEELRSVVESNDNEMVFVELTCATKELEKRIIDPSRKQCGKLSSLNEFRKLRKAGAFITPGIPESRLSLDVTDVQARDAAKWIANKLKKVGPPRNAATRKSVKEAYSNWSRTYDQDRNLTRDLDLIVSRQLLADMKCKTVVEIGCGTAKNTSMLTQIGEEVLALDFSKRMIDVAKTKLRKLGIRNVKFRVADITKNWPCKDQSADLVVCNLVLEHIEDIDFVFSEAARSLTKHGCFFVCELHPSRQYQGTRANYQRKGETLKIDAFVHHITDFLAAARSNGLTLKRFDEWWHEEDRNKPPRLVSFMFRKG